MKYLSLALGFLFLSTPAFASYVNIEKCLVGGTDIFSHKEICEKDTGSDCVKFDGGVCGIHNKVEIIGDDTSNPIYSKTEIESCDGEEVCLKNSIEKSCKDDSRVLINQDYTELYCSKLIGYPQIVVEKRLVVDPVKKSTHDAAMREKENLAKMESDKLVLLEEKLKNVKKSDLSSDAKTVDVVMDILELLKSKR